VFDGLINNLFLNLSTSYVLIYFICQGYAVALLFEALRYKPEGYRLDSCRVFEIFHYAVGSTHPVTKMSTRGFSWV
jgi:hypothetical protein